MKSLILTLTLLLSPIAFAEEDLSIPNTRQETAFDRFVCKSLDDEKAGIPAPSSIAEHDIRFLNLFSDDLVIEFLLTATFRAGEAECRYSATLVRGRKNTIVRTNSKAYASTPDVDCSAGKAQLDAMTKQMPFDHDLKPFCQLALKIPVSGADCGEGNTHVKMVFWRIRLIGGDLAGGEGPDKVQRNCAR